MDNETLLNEIKLRRDLHSVIKHLAILALRVFELEKKLGIEPEKSQDEEE